MTTLESVIEAIEKNGDAMKSGQIADATGLDKKEVDKAITQLKKTEKIYSPKRCFYDIKK